MRVSVAGIWRHPRSNVLWFRVAVPARFRHAIGKREIKVSLHTTDIEVARQRHATKLRETRDLFARLEVEQVAATREEAERVCALGFDQLAKRNLAQRDDGVTTLDDALDSVVSAMWRFLAYRVRLTWGPDHAYRAEMELMGEIADDFVVPVTQPLGFIGSEQQDAAVARILAFDSALVDIPRAEGPLFGERALSGDPAYDGLGSREIVRALLDGRNWAAAEYETLLVAHVAGVDVVLKSPLFDALAECVLKRLAEHRSSSWAANVDQLSPPIVIASSAVEAGELTTATTPRISELFVKWCENRGVDLDRLDKTASEWKPGLTRFVALHGDLAVDCITKAMVIAFRDALAKLPARPKRSLAKLSVTDQIAAAAAQGLVRLSPPSVERT